MKTILLTGATRGLGRALTRALDARDDVQLVLAVRDVQAGEALARGLRRPARVVALDMSSLEQVARFTRAWREPLWALVNNAGLQLSGPLRLTAEGFEETLAVNHLAPTGLTLGLLPWLRGGRVLGIGSGTHHPGNRMATVFGFRGGRFTSVEALARGESDGQGDLQQQRDRYATSKLLTVVTAGELARRHPDTTFLTLDPGLMPGTGLARTAPWLARLAWSTVLRWLVPVLPDASTPERSAAAGCRVLFEEGARSGEVYDFLAQPSKRVWEAAREPALGRRVVDETVALLQPRWPLPAQGARLAAAR